MKVLVFLVLSLTAVAEGLTKEGAISRVTVQLVRKDWRPKGYDPGTDEALVAFPGNFTLLENIFVQYKMFEHVDRPLRNAVELFDDPHYNSSLPSLILTHPLTVGESVFITHTVLLLSLRNLQKAYNVFAMHAPWLSMHFQLTCLRTMTGFKTMFEPMSEAFASFLLDGISLGKLRPNQINFIGFSYAATLNGYTARVIKKHTGKLVHTIFALDAFQHNYNNVYFKRLSAKDATFVHMIHSSSRLGGTLARVATVDIVLNNGYLQPGCEGFFTSVGCSHRRSVAVYMFALLAAGNVVARECKSWEKFTNCQCTDEAGHSLLVVTFPVNQEARGLFFVRTNSDPPYTIGPKGAYCAADAQSYHAVYDYFKLSQDNK